MWQLLAAAALNAAGSYFGGREQSDAAKDAGATALQGTREQLALLDYFYRQSRSDQMPWLTAGGSAVQEYARQLGLQPSAAQPDVARPNNMNAGLSAGPSAASGGSSGLGGRIAAGGIVAGMGSALAENSSSVLGLGALSGILGFDQRPHVRDRDQYAQAAANGIEIIPGVVHGHNNLIGIRGNEVYSFGSRGGQLIGTIGEGGFDFGQTTAAYEGNQVSIDAQGNVRAGNRVLRQAPSAPTTSTVPTAETPVPVSGLTDGRYGAFFESPGYQFVFDETMRAARQRGSAQGTLYSGRMLRELSRYGAGLASTEYGNYMSRLGTLAGIGQSSAQSVGSLGANAGANSASAISGGYGAYGTSQLYGGAARAGSISGIANSAGNLLRDYYMLGS